MAERPRDACSAQISDGRGRRPPTTVRVRVIALSCCIKISAVHYLVLSQNTRVRETDGQTVERTDRVMNPKTALA